jgi:hypothetical protein
VSDPLVIGPAGWHDGVSILEEVVDWTSRWLHQPDGPDAGAPWAFTEQQLRILDHWYAYDPATGRWLYRRGTIRMMKGWGKDPVAAVLAMLELCGPCRVERSGTGWRAAAHPAPWVDIAAVAREQTKNTMRVFPSLVPARTVARYGLDMNKEIIYRSGGGTIQAVTSSPYALEGGRATLVIRNETQYWFRANEGHEMAEVIDGNLAKSRDGAARAMSLCNAHVPGEDSVGEREWDAAQAMMEGRTRVQDILYVAVEAAPDTKLDDEASLRAGLEGARGGSTWLDVDRLVNEVWDPRTTPTEARRKYLNQVVAAEDAYLAPEEWRPCADPDLRLQDGEAIALGFDGSKTQDHTGLVATRIEDGAVFVLGHWDPERHGGEVPRLEVDAAVADAMERYDVVAFYSDLHPFESYVDAWEKEYGPLDRSKGLCLAASTKHLIAWDMRARQRDFIRAAERIHAEIVDGVLKFQPHAGLTEHALNARRRVDRHGVGFGKETRESSRKVDLLAAMMLSRLAWHDYVSLPEAKKRRKRTGRAVFA